MSPTCGMLSLTSALSAAPAPLSNLKAAEKIGGLPAGFPVASELPVAASLLAGLPPLGLLGDHLGWVCFPSCSIYCIILGGGAALGSQGIHMGHIHCGNPRSHPPPQPPAMGLQLSWWRALWGGGCRGQR